MKTLNWHPLIAGPPREAVEPKENRFLECLGLLVGELQLGKRSFKNAKRVGEYAEDFVITVHVGVAQRLA